MHLKTFRPIVLVSIFMLLAPVSMPLALAQGNLSGAGMTEAAASVSSQLRSVGTFDVAPIAGAAGEGRATGSVVSSLVAESGTGANGAGILRDFAVASASGEASAKVFSAIDIQGFTPTTKLQGVGTSSLTLKGEGVLVTMTDAVNSLLVIRATGASDQKVTFHTPEGVSVQKSAAASNVWSVKGAVEGALILVDARGEGAAASGSNVVLEGQNKVTATLKQNAELVFRADTSYHGSAQAQGASAADAAVEAYNKAVVQAIAKGMLAGEATTEFSSGAGLIANANHFTDVAARTDAAVEKRVVTQVRGDSAGRVLAYDVDYVDLPAKSANEVAVYVDGALAQRVDAPAEVNQNAQAGAASYWTTTVEDRVLVLASTGSEANGAGTVTLVSVPDARAAASTLARLDAQLGVVSQVEGSFSLLGDLAASAQGAGQVIGSFSSFHASEAKGDAQVRDYADVRSSTEIFASIHFAAQAATQATADVTAKAQAAGSAASDVQMDTRVAGELVSSATFTDGVLASIVAQAHAATSARFVLSDSVDARILPNTDDKVALLQGADGRLGYLILAKAEGSGSAAGRLDTSTPGQVNVPMQAGESVIFRSSSEAQARANADVAAKAIAQGQLAGEAAVSQVGNAVSATEVDYQSDVDTRVVTEAAATHRGQVTYEVVAKAHAQAQATVVSMVADRSTLSANGAQDILVTVNGEAATRAETAAEVLASAQAKGEAKYFVTTNLQGQTQVLTSIPDLLAGVATRVVMESRLDAQARLNAALDTFGTFQPGYGGAATGTIVSLVAKQEAGLILDYTVASKASAEASAATTKVFDAVKLGTSAFASASASGSSALRFQNEQGAIEAYDVSGAVMKLTATQATSANFDLASDVQARALAGTDDVLMLSSPDFTGALMLVGEGSAAASSGFDASAAAQGQLVANMAAGTTVVFKAFSGFESELSQAQKEAQARAIAAGHLLGHVIVDTKAGASATTTTTANVNYYSHVEAITSVASADKVEILVDSAASAGKSVIISLDRETVSGLIHGDAKLLVDGKAVAMADSYEDALVPDADKYWLITTEGEVGLQAIVTLAHFSTRTITLETPEPPSVFLWTTIGLGVVVVGQAAWPHLRRRGA